MTLEFTEKLEEMFPRYWYQLKDHEKITVCVETIVSIQRVNLIMFTLIINWNY